MKKLTRVLSAALLLTAAILLSVWAPHNTATVQAAVTKPGVPKVTGSASGTKVILKWPAVSGAQGYEVHKYQAADRKYHPFKTYTTKSGVTLKINGKANVTYYYKVRAFKTSNGKKIYGDFRKVYVKTAPSPNTLIYSTTRDKSNSGVIRWKKNTAADGYEIYRSTSKSGNFKKVATIADSGVSGARDTKLSSGSAYYYKVRAYRKNVGSVVYGNFGSIKTMAKYTAPKRVTASSPRNMLIVGDSRVVYMNLFCGANSRVKYIAKSGEGLAWLMSSAIQNQILASLDGKTDIYVWLGTNDYDYYARYYDYYRRIIPQWKAKGANVYLVALGQFLGGADGYGGYDSNLRTFNSYLKNLASGISGVTYLDLYSYLARTGYSFLSGDRVHFSSATTKVVYNYLLSNAK